MNFKKTIKKVKIKNIERELETLCSDSIKYLIIVESPSKCKKIEGFLGNEYKCIASKGHLREIEGLKSIDMKENFKINFTNTKEKGSHIEFMKKMCNCFPKENILLATDDDREGEAIAWHICELFDLPINTTKRIIFHEITKSAVQNAIQNPTTINMQLVYAQHARQVLDMIVGFKISPFLWKYIYSSKSSSLSAGRCQTPALKLIYENDKENNNENNFKYKISGYFLSKNICFQLNNDFAEEVNIIDFLENSKNHKHILSICSPKDSIKCSPKPFNTSRLLQAVNNVLHISPKQTMHYCQLLYQEGYITYMRTENTKYSKEFIDKAKKYIENKWNDKYIGKLDLLEIKDNSNPHEAIRVTQLENTFFKSDDPKLSQVYKIIWKNTLESCMENAKYKCTDIHISAPLNLKYIHTIEQPIFLGWKAVSEEKTNSTNDQNNISGTLLYLQSVEKNNNCVPYNCIETSVHVEKKHNHYTESTLISKLEELGIGRPSTFSMIVDTIQDRGYVKKMDIDGKLYQCNQYKLVNNNIEKKVIEKMFGNEKNKLVIQPIGILTIEFLIKHFNEMFSYEYTKKMEDELDIISYNKDNIIWYDLCNKCNSEIKVLSKNVSKIEKQIYKINDDYVLTFQQYGPVLKKTNNDGSFEYKSVKKNIKIDLDKLKNMEYSVDDLIEIKKDVLGLYENNNVYLKSGAYGLYIEWGENKESIKGIQKEIDDITLEDILPYIKKNNITKGEIYENDTEHVLNDVRLPPPPPNKNILRTIDENTSIRKGKYGPYVYYKTIYMKDPQFFSLSKFKKRIDNCDINVLKEWIRENHNIIFS